MTPEASKRAESDVPEAERTPPAKSVGAALPRPARLPERKLPDWPAAMDADLAASYVSLSVGSLYRLVAANDAPKPIRLTPGRVAWRRADLDAWLARRERAAQPSSEDILKYG